MICSDQPTEILQGAVTYAPNGVSWSRIVPATETYAPSNLAANPVYTHNSIVALDGSITHNLVFTANDPENPLAAM